MKTRKQRGGVLWSNRQKSCNDNEKDWNRVWKHIPEYKVYNPSYLYPGKYNITGSKPLQNGLLNKDGTPRTCPALSHEPTLPPNPPLLPVNSIPNTEEKNRIINKLLYNKIQFESIPNEFKNDSEFVLELLTQKLKFFEFIPIELKQNVDFMIKLVSKNKSFIYKLSDELKNNPEFMLGIIKQNATFLYYGSEEIKDNDTVVTQAILQSGNTLNLASERLSQDLPMIILATEKSSKPLTELTYYQKQILSMKDLPYVKNKLLEDGLFTGIYDKDMPQFGAITYKSGVTYYGGINFKGHRTGKGELKIKTAKINAIWERNNMDEIESITNNSDVILTLDEFETLLPFMQNTNLVYPLSFYRLCGFMQDGHKIDEFLLKMKTYTGIVRLCVLCHGDLHNVPFELPIDELTRISIVPNGVCNNVYSIEYLKTIKTCFLPISEFSDKIKQQFLDLLRFNCNYYEKYDNEDDENGYAAKWFTKCNVLTKIPEKTFRKQDKILNKTYDFNGPSLNILLLIDDTGDYINLFSIKKKFQLTKILSYIPLCSKLFISDFSCSFNELLTEEQLNTWGGTKKRKKKRTLKRLFT